MASGLKGIKQYVIKGIPKKQYILLVLLLTEFSNMQTLFSKCVSEFGIHSTQQVWSI